MSASTTTRTRRAGARIDCWSGRILTSEHDADGVPVTITCSFGPGMDSVSTVTDWNPPQSFTSESKDLGPDAPVVATEWIVEARGGGICVVRVVHSLFAVTDDWDKQLEGRESGWPAFFRLLRMYLTHFPGQPCAAFQLMGFASPPRDAAWRAMFKGLGLGTVAVGQRLQSSGDAPELSGTVELMGEESYPEELLLRLDAPAPGIGQLFAMEMGEQVVVSIRFYLYAAPPRTSSPVRNRPGRRGWGRRFRARRWGPASETNKGAVEKDPQRLLTGDNRLPRRLAAGRTGPVKSISCRDR